MQLRKSHLAFSKAYGFTQVLLLQELFWPGFFNHCDGFQPK